MPRREHRADRRSRIARRGLHENVLVPEAAFERRNQQRIRRRHALSVMLAGLLLAGFSGWFAATHLGVSTDTDLMFADSLPWRQRAMESLRAQRLVSPIVEKLFAAGTGHSGRVAIAVVLLTPPIVFVFLYVNAAVTHACATLLGQNKRGFSATFAACAYGCAPLVLLAIPGCGESVAIVWTAILTGIGTLCHNLRSGIQFSLFCSENRTTDLLVTRER